MNEPNLTKEQLAELQEWRAEAFRPHATDAGERAAHGRFSDLLWSYYPQLLAAAENLHRIYEADGDFSQQLRAENERLRHDIEAYRGALGYSVPGNHDGRLTDGTTPQCGLCNSERRKSLEAENERLSLPVKDFPPLPKIKPITTVLKRIEKGL